MKMLSIAILMVITAPAASAADEADLSYSTPPAIDQCLARAGLTAKFQLDASINPFYVRGDFDGDGKIDYLIRVTSRQNQKHGLISCWGNAGKRATVIGAGTPIPSSIKATFDDLPMIGWSVYGKAPVERGVGEGSPPKLVGEAVLVYASESVSGILYWGDQTFRWYQQGD